MGGFTDHTRRAVDRFGDLLPLAAIPIVVGLTNTGNIERALEPGDTHFGITAGLPTPVPDLWTFVSLPSPNGIHVSPGLPAFLVLLPVVIAVHAALSAGYVGSIHRRLDGRSYDFRGCVTRYFVRFLLYTLAVWAVILGLLGVALAVPVALFVVIPLVFLLAYCFYAVPFLFVTDDEPFFGALDHSLALALDGGHYFRFAVGFALTVAAISIVATPLAVNAGAVGIAIGSLATAPASLVLTAATVSFVEELPRPDP